ncbi:glycosyltransferase [bacterium]|nr:glycosyltransferase [bacterium]
MTDRLNVLLLVDSLPNPADPDSFFWQKNSFVFNAMKRLAVRHNLLHPLFVPFCSRAVAGLYSLLGLTLHFPAPRRGEVDSIRVRTLRYPFVPRLYPSLKSLALRRALRPREFDLVHCHSVYDLGLTGLALKRKYGLPLVVTVYGTDVNWLFESAERRANERIAAATVRVLRGADAVICVSRDLAARVESLGVPQERIHWIPNGYDSALFHPGNRAAERQALGWEQDSTVLLYVGNIFETKGIGDLVEALGILKSSGALPEGFRCVAAGRPTAYGDSLKARLGSLGLADKVEFCGLVPPERVAAMLRACDLFCLPSWREGWPCVVTEALACGAPVVGTDIGGINELLHDSRLGRLCPLRDPRALAAALKAALAQTWDRDYISRSAAACEYGPVAGRIETVYRRVLGHSPAHGRIHEQESAVDAEA